MDNNHPISVVHIASGDLWAGAEVQLFTLATALADIPQINIHVILLNHGKLEQKLRDRGVEVTIFDESRMNGLNILFSLIKAIHKIKPQIIHTHRLKENITGSIAAILNGNITSLRTTHGAPEHKPAWNHLPKRAIYFLDWLLARYSQKAIVAVSSDLADILAVESPRNKIHIIENGIELSQVGDTGSKQQGKGSDDTIKIGIVGRLVPVKRVDLFIETAKYLRQHYPALKTEFHIYGDGPLYDELSKLNQTSNTDDMVHFEGHSENIHHDIRQLDALLMTSDHEGLPMTILEAMALKTPIIAHAVGGIPDTLDHGKCGMLVDDHSAEGFAKAINALFADPDQLKELTDTAFERVNTVYSADQNAKSYLALYSMLLNKEPA